MNNDLNCQKEYWDSVAGSKTFTHEPDFDLLKEFCKEESKILDIGCGYGRLVNKLSINGYRDIYGIDISSEMVVKAIESNPNAEFKSFDGATIPYESESFDLVTSFAVLNCIPTDEGQVDHIGEIFRVLKPGGYIYLSDVPLQNDEKNISRYDEFHSKYGIYGTFELEEGVVLRHSDENLLKNLVNEFEEVNCTVKESKSMNGSSYKIFQYFGRKTSL